MALPVVEVEVVEEERRREVKEGRLQMAVVVAYERVVGEQHLM